MKKIKIAMMSYTIDNRPNKGTALCARKLIENLLADDRFEIYLVHYDKVNDPAYSRASEILMPKIKLPYGGRFVSQLLFFWKYRKNKFDIIHWFQPRVYPFYWLAPAKNIIVTAHAAGEYTAAVVLPLSNRIFRIVLKYFNKWVDVVIADSEYGKKEIIQYYKIKPKKIKITYLGGEDYKIIEKSIACKLIVDKYKIKAPFILDVARLAPHKNIDTLIKAYILMKELFIERKEKLVIVGSLFPGCENICELAKNSKYKEDIFFVDFVKQEDLNAFYSAAELFCFPSLNEGFGLPVVEAMASGTPVITSNVTSLPEVAGDAAILVDPLNIEQIAHEMNKVLSDEKLRQNLIKRGLERAKKFIWKETAQKTKEIYFNLMKNGK
ncbi:MAG: glycosyltransferase family 4 protein [Candidatus Terrybacteria bacterium]|nr:glycosyltransferase family 4 protein [Candidatus Terrybacteria bacterium]